MLKTSTTSDQLADLLQTRIMVLDGAMGTMIQRLKLDEAAVRGDRFQQHHKDLNRFSDILCLTHPEKITDIHRAYYEAGADIVETNSFGASPVGMLDFELPLELVEEINTAAVICARRAADEWTKKTLRKPRLGSSAISAATNSTRRAAFEHRHSLVAGQRIVDLISPGVDSASHALRAIPSLLSEPASHHHTPTAMMTINHHRTLILPT